MTYSVARSKADKTEQNINQYLNDCHSKLGVRIDHKNRFVFTIIFDNKNRYIAWTGNYADRPILKNLDGMSRKYPKWIKKHQYPNDKKVRIKILGLKLGASKGETVYWYECLANKKGYSTNIKDLSISKYKSILLDKIEDMLSIAGYNIDKIKELVYGNKCTIA